MLCQNDAATSGVKQGLVDYAVAQEENGSHASSKLGYAYSTLHYAGESAGKAHQ